jgi:glucokinase
MAWQCRTVIPPRSLKRRWTRVVTSAVRRSTCSSLLGAVAGDLALTFCARGGVYIAGGIVPRFADHLIESKFRAPFENKGRFEPYLRGIPISVIIHPDISFIGLNAFFDRNMATTDTSAVHIRS